MSDKRSPMRWSKGITSGLRGVRTHELRRAGKTIAVVQETTGGWFSYGIGLPVSWNTWGAPVSDVEEAKADAMARARAALHAPLSIGRMG